MRTEGQVKHQLKQIIFRHLQKALRKGFKRVSANCVHNRKCDGRGILRDDLVGVCGREDASLMGEVLCDSRIAFCEDLPRTCPHWASRDKEAIKEGFRGMLLGDLGVIAVTYPDIAALMWVLNGDAELEKWLTGELTDEQPTISD